MIAPHWYSSFDGIGQPLKWNTLEDAVKWMSAKTGDEWSVKQVINFAYSCSNYSVPDDFRPSPLKVKLPRSTKVGIYKYFQDLSEQLRDHCKPLSIGIVKEYETSSCFTANLFRYNLVELLQHEETEINHVQVTDDGSGVRFELLEPVNGESDSIYDRLLEASGGKLPISAITCMGAPLRVTVDMVGITAHDLKDLTQKYLLVKKERKELDSKEFSIKETKSKKESPILTDNLMKAVICMAIHKYEYNPNDEKSPVPGMLSAMFSKYGFVITDRTIRGWLKKGKGLLPYQ